MTTGLSARFLAELTVGARDGNVLGLAVSGGGDSMAMLYLAHEAGLRPQVVTVDHGLRPEAADEAVGVGRVCAGLGLPHQVLRWHWDGTGNLQDAARRGRRRLMADWAALSGVTVVALAHTRDDVAETFVMRLARGAGVDGLAAMARRWPEDGVTWLRPLLDVGRGELRDYLRASGRTWVEDPSNDNDRFERVRVRKALAVLRPLGITGERLAEVAGLMAEARDGLERAADQAARNLLSLRGNAVRISTAELADQAAEVQRRLVGRVIQFLVKNDYGPRGAALQALLARVLAGQPAMLSGVRFLDGWAFREVRAVADIVCRPDQWWDGTWRIEGPVPEGCEVRALGAGIALCPNWRDSGLPRAALLVSPALWQGGTLIAAPHAGFGAGYGAISLFSAAALHHSVISH